MKKTLTVFFSALVAFSFLFTACTDKDAPDKRDTIELEATVNGAQEVPATTSAATGAFTGTYNKVTKELTYRVTYSGLTPTAGHIHSISDPNTQIGPVEIPFTNVASSPITGTARLTQKQENDLIFGNMYVNLHSTAFPSGEIRGNIRLKEF